MRKTLWRRPGFEELESIMVLSGLAGAAVSTVAPNPIQPTGSIVIDLVVHHRHPTGNILSPLSPA
jgi:hypothetical protein